MKNQIYSLKIYSDEDVFRTIEIRGNESLASLATEILNAFDFEEDHAYGFYSNIRNIYKSDEVYELFSDIDDCEDTPGAKGVKGVLISEVFKVRKKMLFLFDYGDDWMFLVECKKISEANPKIKYPRVIEKVGEAPEQYPDFED